MLKQLKPMGGNNMKKRPRERDEFAENVKKLFVNFSETREFRPELGSAEKIRSELEEIKVPSLKALKEE